MYKHCYQWGSCLILRWIKLRLILRREKNSRSTGENERSTRPTTTTLLTWVPLRINTRLYPGGHPSSYNPVRPGLTWNSVVKGNTLTASANRATRFYLKCLEKVECSISTPKIVSHLTEILSKSSSLTVVNYLIFSDALTTVFQKIWINTNPVLTKSNLLLDFSVFCLSGLACRLRNSTWGKYAWSFHNK